MKVKSYIWIKYKQLKWKVEKIVTIITVTIFMGNITKKINTLENFMWIGILYYGSANK